MKYIVCFSGGHSSALAAIETVRKIGKESTILLNHNISSHVEHKDIKRFKEDVSNYLNIPITYANMENFEELTPLKIARASRGFQVRPGQAFCTSRLKTEPFYRYLEQFPRSEDVHIVYGFDENEENRIYRRSTIIRSMGFIPEFPLAKWERTISSIEDVGICRPITYKIYKHANCIGCLKAGQQHWYCVYCLRPDIWEEAKNTEKQIGHSIIKNIYLEELEPKFWHMKNRQNICPNDKEHNSTFWKRVRHTLPEQENILPCDCAF